MTETVGRHGARGATMWRDRSTRPTQRNGWGHAQDIARERQQSPPQKRTRPPPRRSEGWNEWATPTGPPTEEQTRARWQTPEGEGPSREGRTLADSQPQGGSQQAHRQPQGAKRIVRQRQKPHPKEKAASPKNNLLTGGRAEQVDLEADLRPGEHNGENQEPPTTRSFSEDHPVRGRQGLTCFFIRYWLACPHGAAVPLDFWVRSPISGPSVYFLSPRPWRCFPSFGWVCFWS